MIDRRGVLIADVLMSYVREEPLDRDIDLLLLVCLLLLL